VLKPRGLLLLGRHWGRLGADRLEETDVLTVEDYPKVRNHPADKYKPVRIPAAEFAEEVLR
jgi:hypothetical protein